MAETGAQAQQARDLRRVPPFEPRRLRWQIRRDAATNGLVVVGGVALIVLLVSMGPQSTLAAVGIMAVAVAGWLALGLMTARVSRELPRITLLIESDPAAAEDLLARQLARRPLLRWVRLLLYHRLALLRHHGHQFGETAAICQSVLAQPLGPARQARPHLLLMLAEACLEAGHLPGAWTALMQLYHTRLGLTEALQRLALQTRYEVDAGYNDLVLHGLDGKLQMAELMPVSQCGTMHVLLAVAADRAERPEIAQRLWERARLLCNPEQLEQLRQRGYGMEPPAEPDARQSHP